MWYQSLLRSVDMLVAGRAGHGTFRRAGPLRAPSAREGSQEWSHPGDVFDWTCCRRRPLTSPAMSPPHHLHSPPFSVAPGLLRSIETHAVDHGMLKRFLCVLNHCG